jgi:hypothetical protein
MPAADVPLTCPSHRDRAARSKRHILAGQGSIDSQPAVWQKPATEGEVR